MTIVNIRPGARLRVASRGVTQDDLDTAIGAIIIDTTNLADLSVTTAKLADNAVTAAKLANNSVDTDSIINDAVDSSKILDGCITFGLIADNAVRSNHIAANNVTSAHLDDLAVQTGHIAENAVRTVHIAPAQITTVHIDDNAVANTQLATMVEGTVKMRRPGTGLGDPTDTTLATLKGDLAITTEDIGGLDDELAAFDDVHAELLHDAGLSELASMWSATVTGEPAARVAISDAEIVFDGSWGVTIGLTGAAKRAPRQVYRLLPGHKYEVLAAAERETDPTDPLGDSVSLRVAWLSAAKAQVALADLETFDLLTASGLHIYRKVVALTAGDEVDVVAPGGTVYFTPFLETYGADGVTRILPYVRVTDLTSATLISGDIAGLDARLADLESQNLDERLTVVEGLVGGSEIARFVTRADAVAAATAGDIPASVDMLEVLAYATAGDGGAAPYRRMGSAPDHDGWFLDNDGSYWVYQTQNGYARVAAFGTGIAALVTAWTVSKKIICTDGETYVFTSAAHSLISDGEDVDIVAPNSAFSANVQEIPFHLRGGWDAIQVPSAVTATTWTVPDASQYAVGDVVKLAAPDTPLWHYIAGTGRKGEFAIVRSIAGAIITFAAATTYTYYTTESLQIGKLRDNKIRVDLGSLYVHTDLASWTKWAMLFVEAARSPDLRVRRSHRMGEDLIDVMSCYGGFATVDHCTGQVGGPADSPGSYTIGINNSEYVTLRVGMASNVWAGVDGVSTSSTTGRGTELSKSGHCAHNTVLDSETHGCAAASFAWHHGTWRNRRVNCRSFGAVGGAFSDRGMYNETIDGLSVRDESGAGALRQSGFSGAGAVGTFAGRAAHNGEANLFTYISTDGDGAGISTPVAFVHGSGAGVWGSALHYDGPLLAKYARGAVTDESIYINLRVINPLSEYWAGVTGCGSVTFINPDWQASIPPAAALTRIISQQDGELRIQGGRIVDTRDISTQGIALADTATKVAIRGTVFDLSGTLSSFTLISLGDADAMIDLDSVRVRNTSTLQGLIEVTTGSMLTGSRLVNVEADLVTSIAVGITDSQVFEAMRGRIFLNGGPQGKKVTLADDTTVSLTVPTTSGIYEINCNANGVTTASPRGLFWAQTDASPLIVALTTFDALMTLSTADLDETTATDTHVSICSRPNTIKLVNRSGASRTVTISRLSAI